MVAVQKVWGFLKALFWLERLDRLAQEKRWFVFKILPWGGRIFLFGYIVGILSYTGLLIMRPSIENLVMLVGTLVFIPLAYRLTMAIQIKFHSLIG
jgi:hypothetical protein